MNFFDKLYYIMYCTATFGADKPYSVEQHPKLVPPQSKTKGLFALAATMYIFDFTKYTGLIFLVDDKESRLHIGLVLIIAALGLTYWYFSRKDRDDKIVAYYNNRKELKKQDSNWGFLYLIGSFIILMAYDWVKAQGVPLPLIQSLIK